MRTATCNTFQTHLSLVTGTAKIPRSLALDLKLKWLVLIIEIQDEGHMLVFKQVQSLVTQQYPPPNFRKRCSNWNCTLGTLEK